MVATRPVRRRRRCARDLVRRRDRGVRLEDVVRLRVDREVPDLVVPGLVDVTGVDRARELRERLARVGRAVDVDVLRSVVVREAHLRRAVRGDPLAVVRAGDIRACRVECPRLPVVGGRRHGDVREGQARDVDVVVPRRVLRGARRPGRCRRRPVRSRCCCPTTPGPARRGRGSASHRRVERHASVPFPSAVFGRGVEDAVRARADRRLRRGVGAFVRAVGQVMPGV